MMQQDYVTKADLATLEERINDRFDRYAALIDRIIGIVEDLQQGMTALTSRVDGLAAHVDRIDHRLEYLDGKIDGTREGVLAAIAALDQKYDQEFIHMVDKLDQILKWGAYRDDLGR